MEFAIAALKAESRILGEDADQDTHFIGIKITDQSVIEEAVKVQGKLTDGTVDPAVRCVASAQFHLPICSLRVHQPEEEAKLARVFTDCIVPDVKALMLQYSHINQGLRIRGLNYSDQGILYAKAKPESTSPFWSVVNAVKDRINGQPDLRVSNYLYPIPHVVLVKVDTQAVREYSPYRSIYYSDMSLHYNMRRDYLDLDLGLQPLDNLQLCAIQAKSDGFFTTLSLLIHHQ